MQQATLYTPLSSDGHLSCFYFLAHVNNAAVDICVQVSVWAYVFISLGSVPRSRIAELYVTHFFEELPNFSKVAAVAYILTRIL